MDKSKKITYLIVAIVIIFIVFLSLKSLDRPSKEETYPNEVIAGLEVQRKNHPEDKDILLKLALEYNKIDQKDKVEALYKKLIEINPGEIVYYFNLGMQYYYQERFEESADMLLRGQKINPKMFQFYLPLLDMYEDERSREYIDIDYLISEFERLDAEYGSGKALVDDYIADITYLARAYNLHGDYEKSLETYKKMKELKIGNQEFIQEEIERLTKLLENK